MVFRLLSVQRYNVFYIFVLKVLTYFTFFLMNDENQLEE